MSTASSSSLEELQEEDLLNQYFYILEKMGIDPNAPPISPPTIHPIPEQLRELVRTEIDRVNRNESVGRRINAGGTLQFRLEPEKVQYRRLAIPNQSNAQAMMKRHNVHLISAQFINLVRRIEQEPRNGKLLDEYDKLLNIAKWFGFFILPYSEGTMLSRLQAKYKSGSAEYAVMEGIAQHPDPDHLMHNKKMRGADCHIHLPDILQNAKPVNEPLESKDEVKDEDWVKGIMEQQPHHIACVDDIQCIRELSHLRLASHTLDAALDDVLDRVNPQRPAESQITYVTAEIAMLQGIITPDGQEIRLRRDLNLTPLPNGRSDYVFEHFNHARWSPFTTAFIRRDRRHPLVLRDENNNKHNYQIIADWWVKYSTKKE